jgi:hypothetical protein
VEILQSYSVVSCLVRAVYKFYFRLVNETSNKWRQQKKGNAVIVNYLFDTVCMFSFPTVVASVNGTLAELEVTCMLPELGTIYSAGKRIGQKMYTVIVEANQVHNSTLYPHLNRSLV